MQLNAAWAVPAALALGILIGGAIMASCYMVRRTVRIRRAMSDPTLGPTAEALLHSMPIPAVAFGSSLRQIFHNPAYEEDSSAVRKVRTEEWFQRAIMAALVDGQATSRPADESNPEDVHILPLPGPLVVALVASEEDRFATEALRRDFIANASHELNTPVAAISLLAEAILASVDDNEKARKFAESLVAEAGRLGALTKDIVRLSEAQSAEDQDELKPVEIEKVAKKVIAEHEALAEGAQVKLSYSVSDSVGYGAPHLVAGRPKAIRVAISNLIENAITHSPALGQVGVRVVTKDSRVLVQVTDQGPGIPVQNRDKIFQRFWRADDARTRASGGTGLGLSIARNTARSLGGELSVWSEVGVGSTFTLELPLAGPPAEERAKADGFQESYTATRGSDVT